MTSQHQPPLAGELRTPSKGGLFGNVGQTLHFPGGGSSSGCGGGMPPPPSPAMHPKMPNAASPVFALDSPGVIGTPQPGDGASKVRAHFLGMIDEHTHESGPPAQTETSGGDGGSPEWEGRFAAKLAGAVGGKLDDQTEKLSLLLLPELGQLKVQLSNAMAEIGRLESEKSR